MQPDATPDGAPESARLPSFSIDGHANFHLRGAGLQQICRLVMAEFPEQHL